jgi:DNA-binding transcriptional LysR family regulator
MSDSSPADIRNLDGNLLLVFRELVQRRRVTEVGRQLGLSQSGVSHALARLRILFDDPLFLRRSHGLEPTRRALELAPRVDALIDLARATLSGQEAFDPPRSQRRFALSASEFVIAITGARLLERFRAAAPRASFTVQHLPPVRALEAIRSGEIDLAVARFGRLPDGFASELVFRDRYCVVARSGHPTIQRRISLPAFAKTGHVFAGSAAEGGPGEPLPNPSEIATRAVVPRWLTALVLVATSDAIATCPRRLAQCYARTLGLQVLKAPFSQEPFEISAVRKAGVRDPGAEWFLHELREALRE